ncbi:hypothetical protein KKHLCK_17055 [Candidatus Electrothrix laxa]
MAKTDLTRQQKEVLGILADNPQGVGVRQIIQSLQAPPHKRTVQRWLLKDTYPLSVRAERRSTGCLLTSMTS